MQDDEPNNAENTRQQAAQWERRLKRIVGWCVAIMIAILAPPIWLPIHYGDTVQAILNYLLAVVVLLILSIGIWLLITAIRQDTSVLKSWGLRLILIGGSVMLICMSFAVASSFGWLSPHTPIFVPLIIVGLVGVAIVLLGCLIGIGETIVGGVKGYRAARRRP